MIARTPAPKAKDYSVVPGSLGPRRDFRISVGLREGWDAEGRVFDVSEAVRTARATPRPVRHSAPGGFFSGESKMPKPLSIEIVRRAYELWQQAGEPEGRDEEFYP
jgi:hypothetical protein